MFLTRVCCQKPIASALALASLAAGAPAVSAQGDGAFLLEEIVVTAQKREQNLSDVPVAVTALSGDAIEAIGATNIENIQALVPSLSFGKGGTNRNSNLSLRGVGTISFSVGAEPSVSTIVDGVVMARAGQAFADLFDIERIEVLRGPQGTLFGKNASSGVVNIVTRGPNTEEFEASLEAGFFEDNEWRMKAIASGPLSDTVAYRVVGSVAEFDGFVKNNFNGEDIYGYDRQGFRGMLDINPSESVNIRLIGEYYETDDLCCAELIAFDDGSLQAQVFENGIVNPSGEQVGVGDIDGFKTDEVAINATQKTENETTGFSAHLDWDLGFATFTAIAGYREWDNTERQDIDDTQFGANERAGDALSIYAGAPVADSYDTVLVGLNTARDYGPQTWEQSSLELRLTSPGGERLDWQVGGFIWNSEVDRTFARYDALCVDDPGGVIGGVDISGLAPGSECPISNIVTPAAQADMTVEFDNWALFGQATYQFTEDLGLTFGARYTDDEVSYTHSRERVGDEYIDLLGNNNGNPNDDGGVFALQVDKPETRDTASETDFSVKTALHYDITDYLMGYVSYAQGYKGPAFNVFFNMRDPQNLPPIAAEESDAYEVGLKWQFDRAVLNLALFLQDYDDFQANSFILTAGAVTTNLTNAGEVRTQGIEFDFLAQATENLQFYGGITYANAEIQKFDCSIAIAAGEECSTRNGEDLPFAPKVKGSFSGDYTIPLDAMNIILNTGISFQSESFASQNENDAQRIPAYALVNTSLAFSWDDDAYRLTLYGNNLFDEDYPAAYNENGRVVRLARDSGLYFGVGFRANF